MSAVTVEELVVRFRGEDAGLQQMLRQRAKDMDAMRQEAAAWKKELIGGFGGRLAGGGVMSGFGGSQFGLNFAKEAVGLAASAERTQISFEVMLGSARKASNLVADIQRYAAETPLNMKDLTGASKTLLQFGVELEDLMPTLKRVGDVTGGDSEAFQHMALAFGQMSATGHLMGQDLLQMINAGFNPLKEISRTTGKSMGQLKAEMEQGKISVTDVAKAFRTATGPGGAFNDMMKKTGQSIEGLSSTLKDDFDAALRTVGEDLVKTFDVKDNIKGLSSGLQSVTKWWRELAPPMKEGVTYFAAGTAGAAALVGGLGALKFALGGLVGIAGNLAGGLAGVAKGFGTAATSAAGLKASAVAAAGYGIYRVADRLNDDRPAVKDLRANLEAGAVLQNVLLGRREKENDAFFGRLQGMNVEDQRKALRAQVAGLDKNIDGPMGLRNAALEAQKQLGEAKGGIWGNMQDMLGWNPNADQARARAGDAEALLKQAMDAKAKAADQLGFIDNKGQSKAMAEDLSTLNAELDKHFKHLGMTKEEIIAYDLAQKGLNKTLKDELDQKIKLNEIGDLAAGKAKGMKLMLEQLKDEAAALRVNPLDAPLAKFGDLFAGGIMKPGVDFKDWDNFKQMLGKHYEVEGLKTTRQLMTPMEKAAEEQERLNALFDAGAISSEVLSRGILEATKNLSEYSAAAHGVQGIGLGSAESFAALGQFARQQDQPRVLANQMAEYTRNRRAGNGLQGGQGTGKGVEDIVKVLLGVRADLQKAQAEKNQIVLKPANFGGR